MQKKRNKRSLMVDLEDRPDWFLFALSLVGSSFGYHLWMFVQFLPSRIFSSSSFRVGSMTSYPFMLPLRIDSYGWLLLLNPLWHCETEKFEKDGNGVFGVGVGMGWILVEMEGTGVKRNCWLVDNQVGMGMEGGGIRRVVGRRGRKAVCFGEIWKWMNEERFERVVRWLTLW